MENRCRYTHTEKSVQRKGKKDREKNKETHNQRTVKKESNTERERETEKRSIQKERFRKKE